MKNLFLKLIGLVDWTGLKYLFSGRAYDLNASDREVARELMKERVYIWVSRRDTHLSTYMINLADFLLNLFIWAKNFFKGPRPKFGFWSHAFMNYDDNEIVEAVGKGVQKVFFDDVFNCDSIAALIPNNITAREWDLVKNDLIQEMELQIGKKYDLKFDINEENKVSCIELVRLVLKKRIKDYDLKFSEFELMIKKYKNVTPQMLHDSKDFRVVHEVRK